jgi:phosphoserine phosphatase
VDSLHRELPAFVERVLELHWNDLVVRRLERLRALGISLHLLTGAPDFIADAVGARWGMDSTTGTALEVVDGRFTGRLNGPHCFAEAKRRAVLALARQRGIDLSASWGFADHRTDIAFLECFGRAVAVRPDTRLGHEAAQRGWEVLDGQS